MARRPTSSANGTAAYDAFMESENDMQISLIKDKVGALRDVAIQINGHIKEDNAMLDGLGSSFDSAGGLLGGTMKRLGALTNSTGNCTLVYLVAFVLFVFLLLWRLTK